VCAISQKLTGPGLIPTLPFLPDEHQANKTPLK
jgi:hypothetical protein